MGMLKGLLLAPLAVVAVPVAVVVDIAGTMTGDGVRPSSAKKVIDELARAFDE